MIPQTNESHIVGDGCYQYMGKNNLLTPAFAKCVTRFKQIAAVAEIGD